MTGTSVRRHGATNAGARAAREVAPPTGRWAQLDALRATLMLLGVVLHTANIYREGGGWLVADPQQSWVFGAVSDAIHAFRMPAFFVLSGFFCAMTLRRHGRRALLRKRLFRLLVPLAVVGSVVNAPQLVLTGTDPAVVLSAGFWLSGGWVLHLWFLTNLALYFIAAAALGAIADALRLEIAWRPPAGPAGFAVVYLVFVGTFLAAVGLARLHPAFYAQPTMFPSPFNIVWYGLFFALGHVLFAAPGAYRAFLAWGWLGLAAGLAAEAAPAGAALPPPVAAILDNVAFASLTLGYVHAALVVFERLFRRGGALWRRLADSAYTVYLLHHPVVVAVGAALTGFSWGAGPKAAVVLLCGTALPLAVHFGLVRRVALLSLLLNGRLDRLGTPARNGLRPDAAA